MVCYIQEGDIFKIPHVQSYAHGCNCAGAMGKGIAVQFKERFPEMFTQYKDLCKNGEFGVGDVYKYDYGKGFVYNLGTQRSWKEKAKSEYVEKSLRTMMYLALEDFVSEIALLAIGSGLGGWNGIM